MAADHLTSPTAIYAHDVIALNGSPERHCWSSFDDGFGRRLAEVTQSLMDSRDQGRKLVGRNLVALQIGADDLHSEVSIGRCSRRFVGHFGSPCSADKIPCRLNSGR